MKLKSSKTTCNFNHAILLVIVCQALLLKSVCRTISQSIITHNTPTYYSNAHNRSGIKVNFFLGEVELWYSIYVLLAHRYSIYVLAQIRTTWVASTYLFTYALKAIGLLRLVDPKGPDFNFRWKSIELLKLKNLIIFLDEIQWTLRSSHKDICTTIFVLPCKQEATQFEAHLIYKSLLETKTFSNKIKTNYV